MEGKDGPPGGTAPKETGKDRLFDVCFTTSTGISELCNNLGQNYDMGKNDSKSRKNKISYKEGNLIIISYTAQLKYWYGQNKNAE